MLQLSQSLVYHSYDNPDPSARAQKISLSSQSLVGWHTAAEIVGLVSLEGRVKESNIDGIFATNAHLVRVMLVHDKHGPIMLSNIKLMRILSIIPSIFSVPFNVVARLQLKRKTNSDQFQDSFTKRRYWY